MIKKNRTKTPVSEAVRNGKARVLFGALYNIKMELIISIITVFICILYSWKYESQFNTVILSCILVFLIAFKYSTSEIIARITYAIFSISILVWTISILFDKKYSLLTKVLVGISGFIYLHYLNHLPGRGPMALIALLPLIGWIIWAFKEKVIISTELSFAIFFFVLLTIQFGKLVLSWI
jgi:hypothetical protein